MKVVLFCGGLGTRLREYSEAVPKPMVPVGQRPILWHVMKYYAHFGHKEFILCLGYRSDIIKDYFLNYDECVSNDFVLTNGGRSVDLLNSDIDDWKITFVDTGLRSNIGERLKAVEEYLNGEDVFLANYADGVTDMQMPPYLDFFKDRDPVASFMAVKPPQSFHAASIEEGGSVKEMYPMREADIWLNAGFFILKSSIFDYLGRGEDLVLEPFHRLIGEGELAAYRYDGFFAPMDTFKDKQALDEMHALKQAPWQVWNPASTDAT